MISLFSCGLQVISSIPYIKLSFMMKMSNPMCKLRCLPEFQTRTHYQRTHSHPWFMKTPRNYREAGPSGFPSETSLAFISSMSASTECHHDSPFMFPTQSQGHAGSTQWHLPLSHNNMELISFSKIFNVICFIIYKLSSLVTGSKINLHNLFLFSL